MVDSSTYAGVPRWAKVLGAIGVAVALAFVALHLAGRHGGMHMHGSVPVVQPAGAERNGPEP